MKLLLFLLPLIAITYFLAVFSPQFSWNWAASWPASLSSSSVEDFPSNTTTPYNTELLSDDTVLNQSLSSSSSSSFFSSSSSSPPPPAVQILQHKPNLTVEEGFGAAINESRSVYSETDEASGRGERRSRERKDRELGRVEEGLRRARAVIREAKFGNQTQDPDFVPVGPMYWNANAFHRSYLEMEKHFKIFVYEEGEPPLFHNGPCKSIYSTEGNFIHAIEMDTRFRTKDPNSAHVFFLPISVAMLVRFVYVRDSHDFSTIRQTVVDYVDVVGQKYPFWNRSLGADHFMLSCHDWGPEASKSVPHLYKNSIRVLCNANTSEGFKPSKDVSFPEINLQTGHLSGFTGGPSPSHRPLLAFFAGGLHGPIRPLLIRHWHNKHPLISVHQYLPKGLSYIQTMRNSKFCLCPSGYEVASPRIVEAIYTGCVPVLISDHYVAPFSDVLNWKAFSVEVSVTDIPNLKRILDGISTRQYLRMYRRVLSVRRHFEVNSPPTRFDFYHMILHSVWLRRLNVRVGHDHVAQEQAM